MYKEDYLEFIKKNIGDNYKISNGCFCIWVFNPEENHGYKFFFKEWGGPINYLISKDLAPITQYVNCIIPELGLASKNGHKLLGIEDLKHYFQFSKNLFNLNLVPQPIEIFEHKSVYGIKYKKIPPITSDKLWEDRYNILLPTYNKIWSKYYSEWLLKKGQKHNFGQIGDNLLLLDLDFEGSNTTYDFKKHMFIKRN
tara:strand:- start:2417 stop:3007 length:591 start_codon:yes stop_codon:yes gene_type:complete